MFKNSKTHLCSNKTIVPCHRAMAVLAWFENNARRKMLFPPQSPDVNPIKNIWSSQKRTHQRSNQPHVKKLKQHYLEVLTELVLQR